jgi:hypothetical protein
MENITLTPEQIRSFRKFSDNFESFNRMHNELQSHVGKYVAISDGKVLGYAHTKEELLGKFKTVPGIFIEQITENNLLWIL